MVLRDDRELLAHLAQVNSEVPGLALRLMNDELPVDEQRAFAARLADIADAVLTHAHRRDPTIIEHPPPAGPAAAAPDRATAMSWHAVLDNPADGSPVVLPPL